MPPASDNLWLRDFGGFLWGLRLHGWGEVVGESGRELLHVSGRESWTGICKETSK